MAQKFDGSLDEIFEYLVARKDPNKLKKYQKAIILAYKEDDFTTKFLQYISKNKLNYHWSNNFTKSLKKCIQASIPIDTKYREYIKQKKLLGSQYNEFIDNLNNKVYFVNIIA